MLPINVNVVNKLNISRGKMLNNDDLIEPNLVPVGIVVVFLAVNHTV